MPINDNPTIRQRWLARQLRELRGAAGLTHADAAKALGSAESKIGRIENAQSGIRVPDLNALLDAYGVTDAELRADLADLARAAKRKGWWTRYADAVHATYTAYVAAEWDASELYNVQTSLVPGLLQTPEYAEAVIRLENPDFPEEAVEAQIRVRRERWKVLTRENPLHLWVILTENVLYHRVGGSAVMKGQLEALIETSRLPNVDLQILPRTDPMSACLYGPFVIMSFPRTVESDIVYAESPVGAIYYEEAADVDAYATLFRRLNVAAANVTKSRALIREALKELE
ncbi:helix-turn-helix transcriptional regulator [Streptomyces sp. DSM 44917]|uniref:Helix-turn-helix transcriptional regulator n=1 Tax=Streptomyces boetiae TaxID=3075541 RepID=A0ABU2L5S4_9ACTN|nr:helix-turn-helix transcriptional regulator [Streptomyces sp. DSM 44917]MDT0306909.1 helix-turn-helix transcriptional regulator [Streptomyces sp. DSM 44917]